MTVPHTNRFQAIGCSLSEVELAARQASWEDISEAVLDRVRTPAGFRAEFQREPGLSEALRALVARERECCGWASWTVVEQDERVVLEVGGSAPQIDNLAAAFGL